MAGYPMRCANAEHQSICDQESACWRLTATVALATKSPREFPMAKIVSPRMASEMPKMWPSVSTKRGQSALILWKTRHKGISLTCKTPTTSLTIMRIHTMAIPNPRKERMMRPRCRVSVKKR